jgi:hypothetical protein
VPEGPDVHPPVRGRDEADRVARGDKDPSLLLGEGFHEPADGDQRLAETAERVVPRDVGPERSREEIATVLGMGMKEEEGKERGGLPRREGARQERTVLPDLEAPQEANGQRPVVRSESKDRHGERLRSPK